MKKTKVLFIYPNHPALGVVPNSIAILSACLKRAGFETRLFDASLYRTKDKTNDELRTSLDQVKTSDIDRYISFRTTDILTDIVNLVEEYKPDLIAASVVDETLPLGISLLEAIGNHKIPTIVGGVSATFNYEYILRHDCVDIVCIGEGEEALVELCERMGKGEDYGNVRNLYLKAKDGSVKKNPLRPLVDINTLPMPDFSIFEDFRFYRPFHGKVVRMADFDIDRGCPYGCTYCAAPAIKEICGNEKIGQYFRRKNIDKIFEELKYVVKTKDINCVWFSSETFLNQSDEAFDKFAQRYIEEINLPFWCQTRLDTFTEFKTKRLEEMGCKAISVGLEHGNEDFRRSILNKSISNEQILKAFRIIAKHNIVITVNNIVGFPDETRELVFDTIELNREINSIMQGKTTINSFIFVPYTGTPLRKLCIEKGYLKDEYVTSTSAFYKKSVLRMPSISAEEILSLEKTLLFYIKLPKTYYPEIKIAERNDAQGNEMLKKLSQALSIGGSKV